jgi:hypothetical protein
VAQPVNISINISAFHLMAAVAITPILFRASFSEKRFDEMLETVYAAGKNLILDSPVIAFVTGLTYAVHEFSQSNPALVLSLEGSMKAAVFVGGMFALKSVLTPLLEKVTESKLGVLLDLSQSQNQEVPSESLVRNVIVLHFFPLAVGCVYAYYASVPVRLAQSALYTAALIGVVKLLGKGVESFCKMKEVKETINDWYFGLNK